MMNEEKMVLVHLKRKLLELAEKKDGSRFLYPEDVLCMIAEFETDIVLGFPDQGLPFNDITE